MFGITEAIWLVIQLVACWLAGRYVHERYGLFFGMLAGVVTWLLMNAIMRGLAYMAHAKRKEKEAP